MIVAVSLGNGLTILQGWTILDSDQIVLGVVSTVATRLFIRQSVCRNEEWLRINIEFVKRMFTTVRVMRSFPQSVTPVLGFCLPSRYHMLQGMRQMHAHLLALIHERQQWALCRENGPQMCCNMMDHAEGDDVKPERRVLRCTYTILRALQTVFGTIMGMLYKIGAYPKHVGSLRQEMQQALDDETGLAETHIQ